MVTNQSGTLNKVQGTALASMKKLKGLSLTHIVGQGAEIFRGDGIDVKLGLVEVDVDTLTWLPTDKVIGLYISGLPEFDPDRIYKVRMNEPLRLTSDIRIGISPGDLHNLRHSLESYCERATLVYDAPEKYVIRRYS